MTEADSRALEDGATLILGGARSGKSAFAEGLIETAGGGIYLATAEVGDDEMAARIAAHRARRGDAWETVEEPLALTVALTDLNRRGRPVLVDCLTLWLSNLLGRGMDAEAEIDELCGLLPRLTLPVMLVSNEVGSGIVPDNALARQFRDLAGLMNQRVAAAAVSLFLVTAGLAQRLK